MEDNMDVASNESGKSEEGKTFSDIQVNDIVKREKEKAAARAADKVRQELESKHREELERVRQEGTRNADNGESDMAGIDDQRIRDILWNEIQKKQAEAEQAAVTRELESTAESFHLKMAKGSEHYDDYNDIMGDFKADSFPNASFLAARMENTPEIMYELVKNPSKLLEIDALAQRDPKLAMRQLERLAGSIKGNLDAKINNVEAPPPVSRLKSSNVSGDSGKMTLRDLKGQSWLRG